MKLKLSLFIGLIFIALIYCNESPNESYTKNDSEKNSLKVTYIAQSGVFVESGSAKVLIDAVFKSDPRWNYPAPSNADLSKMESGTSPFENVSLYFVTHAHIDHFDAISLEKSLNNTPSAKLVTTPNVYNIMKQWCSNFDKIKERVFAPSLNHKESLDTTINNISIHITHLRHHRNLHWPEDVYSFLIDMNDNRILHAGGSTGYFLDEYEQVRYDTMNIDVAILYHHFLSEENTPGRAVIKDYIKPSHILIGHKDNNSNSFMENLKTKFIDEFPNMNVFTETGESWTY